MERLKSSGIQRLCHSVSSRQMPRVLILSYYFPPMGGAEVQRVTRFVRYLPQFNWNPIVVTNKAGYWHSCDPTLLKTLPRNVSIVRIRAINHPGIVHRDRLLREGSNVWESFNKSRKLFDRFRRRLELFDRRHLCFPDENNLWAMHVYLRVRSLIRHFKPHVLFATGFPWSNLELLVKIHNNTGIPAVGDIRDPWSWHPLGHWNTERHQRLEQKLLTGLPYLVTVTRGVKCEYETIYPAIKNRITLIRNGYEIEDCFSAKTKGPVISFAYLGSLSLGDGRSTKRQTLYPFLQAMAKLRREAMAGLEHIQVTVAGNNVEGSRPLVSELQLGNQIKILGHLPADQARHLRETADVLLLVMGNGPKAETYVPLKVYEYLAANRPILAMLPEGSEAGNIILRKQRGVVCRIDDVEDIADGIRRILNGDFEYDPDSDVSEYSCLRATEKLAELFDRLALKKTENSHDKVA